MPPLGEHDRSQDAAGPGAGGRGDRTEDFEADLGHDPGTGQATGHADESHDATDDKELHTLLDLDSEDLDRISILDPGTTLVQGGVYVDLNDPERTPFTALGGRQATAENRYVSKRETDHEMWNQLVGQGREPVVERPAGVDDPSA
jgi:hypothetical protein